MLSLQAVDLTAPQPETPLLAAVAFLKRAFAKGQALGQLPEAAVPARCIPKRLRRYLYEQAGREGRRLRADRYEFWVYRLVRQALEAGDLSCRQRVRFRSFEDDLIPDDAWRDKEALIARLGLPALSRPIAAQLADLECQLEERLQAVNRRIATGDNAHVRITRRGSAVRWTLAYPCPAPAVNHALFDALPPRDIGSIVHFVDRRCPFLHHFDHLLPRFAKRRADARVPRACLVAWGINLGLGRMGETSDLSFQTLQDTSDNYVRLETLGPANDAIGDGIAALPITHHYDLGGLVHSSSDGQKFETRRATINARHGVKYFGLQKGIVSYSLVANHIPVNARIIGAHEHESHYVFDLLFNNTTALRPDVHSTDTHGTNEVNFALLHAFMYQFAPRYADIQEKVRTSLCGFQHPRAYAVCWPLGSSEQLTCCSGDAPIGMMEAAKDGHSLHTPRWLGRLSLARHRQLLGHPLVRALRVEVDHVGSQGAPQVRLAENEQVVQAFPADAAQEAFAEGIHPRSPVRRAQDVDAAVRGHSREVWAKRAVVISDEICRVLPERCGFAQLLSDPGIGGVACDADIHGVRQRFLRRMLGARACCTG